MGREEIKIWEEENMIRICLNLEIALNNKIFFKLVNDNQVLFLKYMRLNEREQISSVRTHYLYGYSHDSLYSPSQLFIKLL